MFAETFLAFCKQKNIFGRTVVILWKIASNCVFYSSSKNLALRWCAYRPINLWLLSLSNPEEKVAKKGSILDRLTAKSLSLLTFPCYTVRCYNFSNSSNDFIRKLDVLFIFCKCVVFSCLEIFIISLFLKLALNFSLLSNKKVAYTSLISVEPLKALELVFM